MLDLVRSGVGLSLARDSLACANRRRTACCWCRDWRSAPSCPSSAWPRAAEPLVAAAFDAVRAAFS